MLDPYDRRLMLDALRPPDGYALDHALGTTYSLDLLALLAAPLAFSIFAEGDTPTTDPLVLLEALQSHADRITVFCDAGRIYVPPADRLLFSRLEDSVIECHAPLGGVFHPKVWLLRYVGDGPVTYRFLCLSRNLTFDRSWDTALVLDGAVKGGFKGANRPLRDFVRSLEEMAVRPLAKARSQAIERLAEEVRRVEWELPEGFGALTFHPLGHQRVPSPSPLADARVDRLLVMAPFVSQKFLAASTVPGRRDVLISRPDQLDACEEAVLSGIDEVLVLEEEALPDGEEDDRLLRGLHAKLLVADQGWDATLWTGSANATSAAYASNVEFVVGLSGRRRLIGVDALLQAAKTGEVSFQSLLGPYARGEGLSAEANAQRELERRADQARRALSAAKLELHVHPDEELDGTWRMELRRDGTVAAVPHVQRIEAWPVTRPADQGARTLSTDADVLCRFDRLPLERVTPFTAFRLHLADGDVVLQDELVLRLPLIGAPDERQATITRALLTSRAEVLKYLLYLLSGSGMEAVQTLIEGPHERAAGAKLADGALFDVPLLESLLRTLDRDPSKLAAVRRVVDELSRTEAGAALLPDGWEDIWRPVMAVVDGVIA